MLVERMKKNEEEEGGENKEPDFFPGQLAISIASSLNASMLSHISPPSNGHEVSPKNVRFEEDEEGRRSWMARHRLERIEGKMPIQPFPEYVSSTIFQHNPSHPLISLFRQFSSLFIKDSSVTVSFSNPSLKLQFKVRFYLFLTHSFVDGPNLVQTL